MNKSTFGQLLAWYSLFPICMRGYVCQRMSHIIILKWVISISQVQIKTSNLEYILYIIVQRQPHPFSNYFILEYEARAKLLKMLWNNKEGCTEDWIFEMYLKQSSIEKICKIAI